MRTYMVAYRFTKFQIGQFIGYMVAYRFTKFQIGQFLKRFAETVVELYLEQ